MFCYAIIFYYGDSVPFVALTILAPFDDSPAMFM